MISLECRRNPIGIARQRMNISNGFVPSWPVTKASFAAYLRGDDDDDEAAMMLSIILLRT